MVLTIAMLFEITLTSLVAEKETVTMDNQSVAADSILKYYENANILAYFDQDLIVFQAAKSGPFEDYDSAAFLKIIHKE